MFATVEHFFFLVYFFTCSNAKVFLLPGTVFWLSLNEFSLSTQTKSDPSEPIIEGKTDIKKSGTWLFGYSHMISEFINCNGKYIESKTII